MPSGMSAIGRIALWQGRHTGPEMSRPSDRLSPIASHPSANSASFVARSRTRLTGRNSSTRSYHGTRSPYSTGHFWSTFGTNALGEMPL